MHSARNQRIIQSSDPSKQRVLPKYDFPLSMVNSTPGVKHVMNYALEEIKGEQKVKLTNDETLVFNRPKYFDGSSRTVWASELYR